MNCRDGLITPFLISRALVGRGGRWRMLSAKRSGMDTNVPSLQNSREERDEQDNGVIQKPRVGSRRG
jgi:hypothetical protein